MRCAACNAEVPLASGERIGLRDTCDRCNADLHTCTNCAHYEPGAYNNCREPNAERVRDAERANRCDWFAPGAAEGGAAEEQRQGALSDLDTLFKK